MAENCSGGSYRRCWFQMGSSSPTPPSTISGSSRWKGISWPDGAEGEGPGEFRRLRWVQEADDGNFRLGPGASAAHRLRGAGFRSPHRVRWHLELPVACLPWRAGNRRLGRCFPWPRSPARGSRSVRGGGGSRFP